MFLDVLGLLLLPGEVPDDHVEKVEAVHLTSPIYLAESGLLLQRNDTLRHTPLFASGSRHFAALSLAKVLGPRSSAPKHGYFASQVSMLPPLVTPICCEIKMKCRYISWRRSIEDPLLQNGETLRQITDI
jgi:hypothetical protein